MQMPAPFEPREVCLRCRRPAKVCYCAHVRTIDTATRVVLLQHPRERDVAIGTARMATLCLPNSELHVGVDWQGSPALARALSDPDRPAALLYPGDGAIDVAERPPSGPITLVVVDGTWWQARKLVRQNPQIAALPRYAFVPRAPSEYRIRREPKDTYVSTIEALAHVLGVLEGDPARFEALLLPFRAMIDAQIEHQQRLHGARARRAARPERKPWRPQLPAILRERADDLVIALGEANAWPLRVETQTPAFPDELVQWAACRVSTGERFERVLRPRQPLGPNTLEHTRLSAGLLEAGGSPAELMEEWRAYLRPSDVVCWWGHHARSLFIAAGGPLPTEEIDLRHIARAFARGHLGTLEELAERWSGAPVVETLGHGRAGARLAHLAAVLRHLIAIARQR